MPLIAVHTVIYDGKTYTAGAELPDVDAKTKSFLLDAGAVIEQPAPSGRKASDKAKKSSRAKGGLDMDVLS